MEITTVLLYVLAAIVAYIAFLIHEQMFYWRKRGIFHEDPTFVVGNMKDVLVTRHYSDPMRDLYKKFKTTGPFCGLYFFLRPAIVVTELDLVKKVLIRDFNNFVDRGNFYNEQDDPLSAHLFSLDETKWRQLRNKFSPSFNSAKMKYMFKTVLDVGNRFTKVFGEEIVKNGSVIEIKELNARFTTDVIGTCAFGIECNSLKDHNSEFRSYGRKIFEKDRYPKLIMGLIECCPNLARWLRVQITCSEIKEFFLKVVRETVTLREKKNITRNDFMDMLIDLKNKTENGEINRELSMEEIAAQTFIIFTGSFETVSSTMSQAMFEMARNPDMQEKARAEINDVLQRHNGVMTHESLGEMQYLGQVIDETLRMYPTLAFLQRRAKEDYDTGFRNYKIEKGTMVFIPVEAIHHDPEIYRNPSKFDPDRFTPEEKQKRHPCAYLPFGVGPRNCIGLRFGKMQTKIGLALMIRNFKFSVCERTRVPLVFDPKHLLKVSVDGIYLKAEKN